jgi:hypothetical protein
MTRWLYGPTAVLLFSLGQAASASADPADDQPGGNPPPTIDVSRLPINLERIHRQLRQTTVREERDGLNLRYIVDVFGQAPPLQLFSKQDNLQFGPTPYGAPTHQDMLRIMTPQEFSAPAATFGNVLNWFSGKSDKDKK